MYLRTFQEVYSREYQKTDSPSVFPKSSNSELLDMVSVRKC